MNSNSKRLEIYLFVMLIATAIATALKTVACTTLLDYTNGFFKDKSLVTVANLIITVTVIGMLSYIFSPKIKLSASFSTSATYVPTGILGVATAFLGVKIFSHVSANASYKIQIKELFTMQGMPTLIGIITGVLAFVSIAYHFFNAFVTESRNVTRAYFSIAAIGFLAFYAILIYLDDTVAINESTKTLRQTAFLAAALFLLYETRISLGREMWRIYSAFGLIAATLTAYTSIPALITYFTKGSVISSYSYKSLASLEEYLFLFAMFIFIALRLFLTVNLKEDAENEIVEALKAKALEREANVQKSLEEYEKIFAARQLSIFDLYGEDEPAEAESESDEIKTEEAEVEKPSMISDDAIYEAIHGRMPDKVSQVEEKVEDTTNERNIDEIAENLLKIHDSTNENKSDI